MFYKKDKKLTFVHSDDYVVENFPILPISKIYKNWQIEKKKSYLNSLNISKLPVSHLHKCPGINNIVNYGYVVQCPFDIYFKWNVDENQHNIIFNDNFKYIPTMFPNKNVVEYIPKLANFSHSVYKIHTGWDLIINNNTTRILFNQLPYHKNIDDFYVYPGILNISESTQINAQITVKNKKDIMINAGDPIMHLIPIETSKYKFKNRIITEDELKKINILHNVREGISLSVDLKKIRDKYSKLFLGR